MKNSYFSLLFIGSLFIVIGLCPLSINSVFAATEVTLGWDENQEDDLEGYAVYKKESSSASFSNVDTLPKNELADPSNPIATITELKDGARYYFAVTAYDVDGNESDFSSSLCVDVSGSSVTECPSGGGGGGGGG